MNDKNVTKNDKIKFGFVEWVNYFDTPRRKNLMDKRENDVRYIVRHSSATMEDLSILPDCMLSDIAYDLRLIYED